MWHELLLHSQGWQPNSRSHNRCGKNADDKVLDKHLYEVSQRTGISMSKLYNMEKAVRQRGSDIITPIELAQACNMTHNSINRLLLKLEGGYARL